MEVSRETELARATRPQHGPIVLVHRTAGVEPAGAGTRTVAEAWGAFGIARDGSRHGQWRSRYSEANADFLNRKLQPL